MSEISIDCVHDETLDKEELELEKYVKELKTRPRRSPRLAEKGDSFKIWLAAYRNEFGLD